NCCACLCAGSALAEVDLLRKVRESVSSLTAPRISQIVAEVKREYINEKMSKAEEDFLLHKGLTIKKLYSGEIEIPPQLFASLDGKIDSITINLELLVCGVDEIGGHIYHISDERFRGIKLGETGLTHCWDSIGYHAIGSGELHAVSTFISHGYTPMFSLEKAIPIVFEAKKNAEKAPGVGKVKTDMAIITRKGFYQLRKEHIEALEKTYRDRMKNRKLEEEMYVYEVGVKEILSNLFQEEKG
ncbi:MAG: hypothetical protein ACTSV7_14470, partial [Candidatus Baldrarchaeia archaeon]